MVESHHAGGERPTGLESLKASPGASAPEMATASAVTQRQLSVAGWYRGMAPQGRRPGKPPGSCKAPGSAQRCRRQVQRDRGCKPRQAGQAPVVLDRLPPRAKGAAFHPQGLEAAPRHFRTIATGSHQDARLECGEREQEGLMAEFDIPAPMTGTVREVLVAIGDVVATGQEIAIIEAMKMEIPVECPRSGTVTVIGVSAPARIEEGQLLLRLSD